VFDYCTLNENVELEYLRVFNSFLIILFDVYKSIHKHITFYKELECSNFLAGLNVLIKK